LEYEHTQEEIRYDPYVRQLYTMMVFSLERAYVIARESLPIMNCYGFDVEPCRDYWKMKWVGIDAGIPGRMNGSRKPRENKLKYTQW
jgi:hypothetical protein